MGKKKKDKAKAKKKLKKAKKKEQQLLLSMAFSKSCKTKCCKKYEKGAHKRCKRCPCFDLLQKVA